MRLWVGLAVAAVAVVTAASALGAPPDSAGATSVATSTRALTDLPDDIAGPQVHFLYIVPSDGVDGQIDTNGAMAQSVLRIERWLVKQTGNQRLRVDTYGGAPDITFVRLPHTGAQATAVNPWPIWVIGEDLVAAGFDEPDKVYAVLYDGPSTWACGGATSPALPKLGVMYLRAQPTGSTIPCSAAPGIGTGLDTPGYFEIGLLHEVLHTLDFVPDCAPHLSADGYTSHANDSPTDLMYAPDATSPAGWNWANAVLDFNRDDYYRANVPGCSDLSTSPYLEPFAPSVSVSVNGSGTVTSDPIGIECPAACSWAYRGPVTLKATPQPGGAFLGWTGACTGAATTCVLTGAGSASAAFAAPHSVSVAISGSGAVASSPAGIQCPAVCSGTFLGSITLTATPLPGGSFLGWGAGCTGTATTCVVTQAASVSASFTAPRSVSVTVNGPGTVSSTPVGIDCPSDCGGMFLGAVTLTATPLDGATFDGWGGACSGTGTCVLTGEGPVTASFSEVPVGTVSHGRSLTLRIRARRATGALRVLDGYQSCRARAPVVVERRGKKGWSTIRRIRTNKAGAYATAVPKGRATYRARAPKTVAGGEICVGAASRSVATSR